MRRRRPGGGHAERLRVAIAGSGNIGTELLHKIRRNPALELAGVAGIVPASEGLALVRRLGYTATHEGLARLLELEPDIDVVFDATSGMMMAELIATGQRPNVLESFRIDRFRRLRPRAAVVG